MKQAKHSLQPMKACGQQDHWGQLRTGGSMIAGGRDQPSRVSWPTGQNSARASIRPASSEPQCEQSVGL
eukprot:764460-Hanusia_phi.AAC.3